MASQALPPPEPAAAPASLPTSIADQLAARMTKASEAEGALPPPPSMDAVPVPAQTEVAPATTTEEPPKTHSPPEETKTEVTEVEEDFELPDLEAEPAKEPEPAEPQPEAAAKPDAEDEADAKIGEVLKGTPRGRRMYSWWKTHQALSKDLGFVPSVEQIQAGQRAALIEQEMISDYASGEPERQQRFLTHWFNPQYNFELGPDGQPVKDPGTGAPVWGPSVRLMAELPKVLAKENPAALNVLSYQVEMGAVQRLLTEASSGKWNPESSRRLKDAAALLVFNRTGKWPDFTQQANGTAVPATAEAGARTPDEVLTLRQQNQRLAEQLRNQQVRQQTEVRQQRESAADTEVRNALTADVRKALEPLEKTADPYTFQAILGRFASEIVEAVMANPDHKKAINARRDEAVQTGSQDSLRALVKEIRQRYYPILRDRRAERLRSAGVTVKSTADATAAKLREAASKTEASGGLRVPTDHQVSMPFKPDESKSQQENIKDYLAMKMSSAVLPT